MTRILVVQNMYPPHHYGGYELSCRDVVEIWRRRGHHVDVLTSSLRVPGASEPPDERGVARTLPIAFGQGELHSPPLWRRYGRERASLRELDAALTATRPDVVSLWHMAALSFGMITRLVRSGVPLVYVVCDDWLSYGPTIDPWMRMFLRRPRAARAISVLTRLPTTIPDLGRSGTFCFVSETTKHRSELYTSWQYPDSTVTYSGIDTTDFPIVRPAAPEAWQWRLLYAGRLDPRKGLETLLRALPLLPDEARLELLGPGEQPYRDRLHRLAADLGVDARIAFGSVARSELAPRYQRADVVVFPSEWEEPFGLVPIEAMACGTPVVATGAGGSAEFLADGENCLRFAAGDEHSLAAAVNRLAADESLRRRIVAGGSVTAADLTVDHLATVLEEWHLAAAGRFAEGRPAHRRLRPPQPA